MNYILKKALEMAAVLGKVSDFFLFKSNRILHLLGCLIGSALLGWEFGVGAGLKATDAGTGLILPPTLSVRWSARSYISQSSNAGRYGTAFHSFRIAPL